MRRFPACFHELLKTPVKPKKIDKPIFNFGHFKTKYEHDLKQYKIKYQYYNAQFARYQKAYHMLEKIRKTVIDYLHLGEPSDKTIPETDILECLSNRLYEVSMRLLQDAGYQNSGETWYL
jgi:hypothetical protein